MRLTIAPVKAADMHPVTHRIYEAVKVLTRSADWPQQTRVASEANVSAQTLNNWEARGPSAQGLLDFQLAHGVSATWLLTGRGPMLMSGGPRRALYAAERPTEYRVWPLSDELLTAIAQLPDEARSRVENGLRGQLGLPPLAARRGVSAPARIYLWPLAASNPLKRDNPAARRAEIVHLLTRIKMLPEGPAGA